MKLKHQKIIGLRNEKVISLKDEKVIGLRDDTKCTIKPKFAATSISSRGWGRGVQGDPSAKQEA